MLVAVLVLLLVLVTGEQPDGSKPAKSGTEAEYEVVDREQPDGAELKQNPAYSVHKTHPQQTNTDTTVYETVDL